MKLRFWICFFVIFAASVPLSAQEQSYRNPGELLDLMKTSKTNYEFRELSELEGINPDDCGKELFPELVPHLEFPWVKTTADGNRCLLRFPMDSVAVQYLIRGEPDF